MLDLRFDRMRAAEDAQRDLVRTATWACRAIVAHATRWKEWSDGSDERYAEALVAVYLTAGRGLIPRRGDWLPGTAWDMSDLAPLSVAERCEPAPEDATFTHVCG